MALECKELAGWRCEHCGIVHGSEAVSRRGEVYIVYLAAAHLDHYPGNFFPRLEHYVRRAMVATIVLARATALVGVGGGTSSIVGTEVPV